MEVGDAVRIAGHIGVGGIHIVVRDGHGNISLEWRWITTQALVNITAPNIRSRVKCVLKAAQQHEFVLTRVADGWEVTNPPESQPNPKTPRPNSEPETRNPKPQTLNQTPNPKSQTLNLKS